MTRPAKLVSTADFFFHLGNVGQFALPFLAQEVLVVRAIVDRFKNRLERKVEIGGNLLGGLGVLANGTRRGSFEGP
jgi:hypothetical protein